MMVGSLANCSIFSMTMDDTSSSFLTKKKKKKNDYSSAIPNHWIFA
jgi:hypothetical protein